MTVQQQSPSPATAVEIVSGPMFRDWLQHALSQDDTLRLNLVMLFGSQADAVTEAAWVRAGADMASVCALHVPSGAAHVVGLWTTPSQRRRGHGRLALTRAVAHCQATGHGPLTFGPPGADELRLARRVQAELGRGALIVAAPETPVL